MLVNREKLLNQLEQVTPGLSTYEVLEQSTCFVFQKGTVYTYNDDVACICKTDLGELKGAVIAKPLVSLLRRMSEEEINIEVEADQFIISGKRKKAVLRIEKEVVLPIDNIEVAEQWNKLPDDFIAAIKAVRDCASKDSSKFVLTCIHIHPKWIEACDGYAVARYVLKTKISEALLIRNSSIQYATSLGMTHFSETKQWIHFKNDTGLILSCRKYIEEYKDLTDYLKVEGKTLPLPKKLAKTIGRAEVLASENTTDEVLVKVSISPGKIQVSGKGAHGIYKEFGKLEYNGEPLSFNIPPSLLTNLLQKYSSCSVSQQRLKVGDDKFTYVTCLGTE